MRRPHATMLLCVALSLSTISYAFPFSANSNSAVEEVSAPEQLQGAFGDLPTLVFFYKSKDKASQNWESTVEESGTRLTGMIKVLAIDMVKNPWLNQMMKVEQVPTITLLPSRLTLGPNQANINPQVYQGARDADAISKWAAKGIPSLSRIIRAEKDWNEFLHAEDKGSLRLPRVVLFSNKVDTPPVFKALSVFFLGRAIFAEVRDKSDAAKIAAVDSFPEVRVYTSPSEGKFEKYEGSNKYSPLREYIEKYALTTEEKETLEKELREEAERKEKEKDKIVTNPTYHAYTPKEWNDKVLAKGGISLVAFLDSSDSGHITNLKTLKAVFAKTRKGGTQYNFVWVDGVKQSALMEFFGVYGTPSVVFVHPKKGWYKVLVGSFSEKSIWSYINVQLMKGSGKSFTIQKLPTFAHEEWTAEQLAAVAIPEEEVETDSNKHPKGTPEEKPATAEKASKAPKASKESDKKTKLEKKTETKKDPKLEERNRARDAAKKKKQQEMEAQREVMKNKRKQEKDLTKIVMQGKLPKVSASGVGLDSSGEVILKFTRGKWLNTRFGGDAVKLVKEDCENEVGIFSTADLGPDNSQEADNAEWKFDNDGKQGLFSVCYQPSFSGSRYYEKVGVVGLGGSKVTETTEHENEESKDRKSKSKKKSNSKKERSEESKTSHDEM